MGYGTERTTDLPTLRGLSDVSASARRQGQTHVAVFRLRRARSTDNRKDDGLAEGRATAAEGPALVRRFDGVSGIFFNRFPIGPHISATPAASLAGKPRLQIGQADIIRPSVAADRSPVRATIIGAVNQKAAHAGHEGDFLAGDGHEALKRGQRREENRVYRLRASSSQLKSSRTVAAAATKSPAK